MNLQDKHVLILGLGESGLAMARWCGREGACLRVADTRAAPPKRAALEQLVPQAEIRCGAFDAALLESIDLVAISPGLAPRLDPQASLLAEAARREIPVWGEIEFFARKLAQLKQDTGYAPKVIAITGTNGKTTVTSLAGRMCARAGLTTAVAGNISPAALDALTDAIDRSALPQVWVLELSSFQLEMTHTLHADAATILNVTQDHLDWHGDMEDYARAKARIFADETVRVLNRDNARSNARDDARDESRDESSGNARASATAVGEAPHLSFGADAPATAGDFGIVREGGMQWLACLESAEVDGDGQPASLPGKEPKKRRRKQAADEPPHLVRLMPVEALRIRGTHNATNALAALALCRAIGLPAAPLLHALRDYRGEAHRVETVARHAGVEYIDDSKGTNVGATVAALEGLAEGEGRLILIAGGDGKGQDFSPLAQPVARHARAVLLIGQDAPAIRAVLSTTGIPLEDCASLEDAVQRAAALAQPGDKVLLSPACASFDMFRDYRHRAEVFVATVATVTAVATLVVPSGATANPVLEQTC